MLLLAGYRRETVLHLCSPVPIVDIRGVRSLFYDPARVSFSPLRHLSGLTGLELFGMDGTSECELLLPVRIRHTPRLLLEASNGAAAFMRRAQKMLETELCRRRKTVPPVPEVKSPKGSSPRENGEHLP